jgi:DegV family protein with EDD domain
MDTRVARALKAGFERIAAWADLLDRINVYPVADGDTGCNLTISLSPFVRGTGGPDDLSRALMQSATGNSGNIAVAFFTAALSSYRPGRWGPCAAAGRDAAWRSVADPQPGTMLAVFDALVQAVDGHPPNAVRPDPRKLIRELDRTVRDSVNLLPELKRAGVVDAGALGMFIFFEGFVSHLMDPAGDMVSVSDRFGDLLDVSGAIDADGPEEYCVNTIIRPPAVSAPAQAIAGLGKSVVTVPDGDHLRVHLHTPDHEATRTRIEALGDVVQWQAESMATGRPASAGAASTDAVHVMTDAAGSLSRDDARSLGVTLLDSYVIVDGRSISESLMDPRTLYGAMASGHRVSTAQASVFQKHQSYQSAVGRFGQVLYLTVGSIYTGNYATACRWRKAGGHETRFTVMDTGAASGRLGLIVRRVARMARNCPSIEKVTAFAHAAIERCGELVFLDRLRFLAAGGRISRSKGFVGDLMGIKPVISPEADGAARVGTVRKSGDQLPFALKHLMHRFTPEANLDILLQFTDNEKRVLDAIAPAVEAQFPNARISFSRLSLTSGAHMGPGTWAVAYCPEI